MQLSLFEECKLDDDSGKCKALSDAMEALTTAVEARKTAKEADDYDQFQLVLGATPIQQAASKLRYAASTFGPEQKAAADAWMKQVTSGEGATAADLLESEIALFGECVLSDGSTPSACEQLEKSLAALQEAIDLEAYYGNLNIQSDDSSDDSIPEELEEEEVVVDEASEATIEATAPARVSGRKRQAVKRLFRKYFPAEQPSPLAVAKFLAEPEAVDPALKGTSVDQLVGDLIADGVSGVVVSTARISVLPYLPGQDAPGVPSMERSE